MMVTMINNVTCWNLEYETDLTSARTPYSRVTILHGRNVKSYELDVACRNLGFQTEDYIKCMSIQEKSEQ